VRIVRIVKLDRRVIIPSHRHHYLSSKLTTFQYRRPGMCQYTVPNDEIDDSLKGKSPVTRVVCCLQDRNEIFYVDSMTDIVTYAYKKMLQKIWNFYRPSVQ